MTATYSRFAHRHTPRRVGLRWAWEITDGIGGSVLAEGRAWTRIGANEASILAQIACEPSLALLVERAADRLARQGLPVRARLDEQDRVCVTPLCACSTRDEVRVLREFLAITPNVREVA